MSTFVAALQDEGLTLAEIVADVPRDAGAVVVFLIFGAMIFFIWFGSRRSVTERYAAPPAVPEDGLEVAPEPLEIEEVSRRNPASAEPPAVNTPIRARHRRPRKGAHTIPFVD